MTELCFHSFPRPRNGEDRSAVLMKGLLIAESLTKNGLLLAPEHFEVPILNERGQRVDAVSVSQNRVCFTEIPPSELAAHSEKFGPFALAFDLDDLRRIGGLPVHYVPMPGGSHLYGLGSEILAGVADAYRVIAALARIRDQIEVSPTLGLTWTRLVGAREVSDGVRLNEEQTTLLRSFLDEFEKMIYSPLGLTSQKLLAAGACFYPTEHSTKTGKLHYYRQREWRIVECGLLQGGMPLAPRATEAQKETLRFIDGEFFGRLVRVPASTGWIGEWEEAVIADRCRFLSRVGDLNVIALAKAMIIPDDLCLAYPLSKSFQLAGIPVLHMSKFEQQG